MKPGRLAYIVARNLAERKGRTAVAVFVITFTVCVVMVVGALSLGFLGGVIRKAEEVFPPGMLMVRPRSLNVSVLSLNTAAITSHTVEAVRKLDGVEYVAPQLALKMPMRAEGEVLGQGASTDALVVGIDPIVVKEELRKGMRFEYEADTSAPIPCVMPRYFLDMYNLAYSESLGLPKINETFAMGKTFELHLGESIITGEGNKMRTVTCKIVGLTPNPSLFVGALIPLRNAEELNRWYTGKQTAEYTAMHVRVRNLAKIDEITSRIESMKLTVESQRQLFERLQFLARAIGLLSAVFAMVIALIAAVSVFNTFSLIMTQRRGEVGLLRAVGGTRNEVTTIYMAEAALIGLISGILGVSASWGVLRWADQEAIKLLPRVSFLPEQLFALDWRMAVACIAGAAVFSLLATLPVILKTTGKDPALLVSES